MHDGLLSLIERVDPTLLKSEYFSNGLHRRANHGSAFADGSIVRCGGRTQVGLSRGRSRAVQGSRGERPRCAARAIRGCQAMSRRHDTVGIGLGFPSHIERPDDVAQDLDATPVNTEERRGPCSVRH